MIVVICASFIFENAAGVIFELISYCNAASDRSVIINLLTHGTFSTDGAYCTQRINFGVFLPSTVVLGSTGLAFAATGAGLTISIPSSLIIVACGISYVILLDPAQGLYWLTLHLFKITPKHPKSKWSHSSNT